MAIVMKCPRCEKVNRFKDDMAGTKASCKECGRSLRVDAIDSNDDENEEREESRRKRGRRSKKASPALGLWLGIGGAAVLVVAIAITVAVLVVRSRRQGPPAANNPLPPANVEQPAKLAPPGPQVAIMEEILASLNAASDAIGQARDRASTKALPARLDAETRKLNALANRLTRAGRPAPADMPRLKELDGKMFPVANRLEGEVRRLQGQVAAMKLDFADAFQLDNSMRDFGMALQNLKTAAQMAQ